ncbi:MAG TPA: hypothetical protein VM689_23810 [Aliidongia sp.]|nr:hypothetical protein [Aliidongia sp.]
MAEDLRQADLSNLTLKQMNAEQRAEMRRRLETFVDAFAARPVSKPSTDKPRTRKWVPGMKR